MSMAELLQLIQPFTAYVFTPYSIYVYAIQRTYLPHTAYVFVPYSIRIYYLPYSIRVYLRWHMYSGSLVWIFFLFWLVALCFTFFHVFETSIVWILGAWILLLPELCLTSRSSFAICWNRRTTLKKLLRCWARIKRKQRWTWIWLLVSNLSSSRLRYNLKIWWCYILCMWPTWCALLLQTKQLMS